MNRNFLMRNPKKTRYLIAAGIFLLSLAALYVKRWYFRLEWRTPVMPIDYSGEVFRGELLLACVAAAACFCAGIIIQNKKDRKIPYIVLALLTPVLSVLIFEISLDEYTVSLQSVRNLVVSALFLSVCYAAVLFLTNSLRGTMIGVSLFFAFVAVINTYVFLFRGKTIYPMDLFSVKTAAEVSGHYDWHPTGAIITALMLEAALCSLWSRCHLKMKGKSRIASLVIVSIALFAANGMMKALPDFIFNRESNGYILNFVYALKNLNLEKPKDYSLEASSDIARNFPSIINIKADTSELPDNIIVIMNESWSDITCLGDFSTSEDMFSCYNSLTENTVKGDLRVSVFGGGTPNSEYEFLTGNTAAALPENAIAYQLFINEYFPTILSYFKNLGYEMISYHPERASNYDRENIYRCLGFDKSYWEGDFDSYENNIYYRGLLSDTSDYMHLTKLFEEKTTDKLFIFNVTSQSHGGFGYPDFDSFVTTKGLSKQYGTVNEYCTLIKLTDNALSELIDYFSNIDERTMILIFGDHQPSLENQFYDEIGQKTGSPDLYRTKFLLWANYDIPEQTYDTISVNYLPLVLLNALEIQPEGYVAFLEELYEEYPEISYTGCCDKNGICSSYKDTVSSSEIMHEYSVLQYNYIHNPSERLDGFFWENISEDRD
ncbi:MAG: LTA synthase family protein [Eubacteriales bacterium]|nr:LTA synthase family protein [Eubacteriales bacterium]